MPALGSVVRQVGDFVAAALLLFGLTSVAAPLDPSLSSIDVEPPRSAGLAAAALVALALLLARPLRLRLVACVWSVGLAMTAVWIPLLASLELQGDPVGILVPRAVAPGVGVAPTYPSLWRAAEARLRVERGAFDSGQARSKSRWTVLARLGRLAIVSKCRTVTGLRGDDSDANRSARLALTFGVAFAVALLLDFILAPDSTGIVPLFLITGLVAVFGLPVYFGLSQASGSES